MFHKINNVVMSTQFADLLRRNVVPDVENDLEVLSENPDIENDPDAFFELTARRRDTDVNNLMSETTLAEILEDIGFSHQAARVLATEMIRRRILSLTRI